MESPAILRLLAAVVGCMAACAVLPAVVTATPAVCVNGSLEIIDNDDGTRFSASAGWTQKTIAPVTNRAPHYNGTMIKSAKTPGLWAYFDASGLATSQCVVGAYWQGNNKTNSIRATAANYTVVHADGATTVLVDQTAQPDINDFFALGTFTFVNGQTGAGVHVNTGSDTTHNIVVDAVSFLCFCEDPTTTSTASPTSASPTSISPTSASPTSASPTSVSPTSASPTSVSPTSVSPTSASPTSVSPTSASPTSVSPTSASPTSVSPTTPAGPDSPAGSMFEVTGADAYPDFNGYYKQEGTYFGYPDFYKVNADGSFTDNQRWKIIYDFWEQQWNFLDNYEFFYPYSVDSSAATPPTTGWVRDSDGSAANIALTYN